MCWQHLCLIEPGGGHTCQAFEAGATEPQQGKVSARFSFVSRGLRCGSRSQHLTEDKWSFLRSMMDDRSASERALWDFECIITITNCFAFISVGFLVCLFLFCFTILWKTSDQGFRNTGWLSFPGNQEQMNQPCTVVEDIKS